MAIRDTVVHKCEFNKFMCIKNVFICLFQDIQYMPKEPDWQNVTTRATITVNCYAKSSNSCVVQLSDVDILCGY